MTQRETVLTLLRLAATVDDGWLCNNVLDREVGRRFASRIGELRHQYGYVIESDTCRCQRCERNRARQRRQGIPQTFVGCYRLVTASERAA